MADPFADDPGSAVDAPLALSRDRALRAFDLGVLAAIGVSLAYGVLLYPVGLTWGLIAVAVMGGWVIGAAVRSGAWRGQLHERARSLQLLAVVLGIFSWLGGMFVSYVLSQALFPDAATPLMERLSAAGFAAYIDGTDRILNIVSLSALAFVGWRSAR
jgi:hypothetical protein